MARKQLAVQRRSGTEVITLKRAVAQQWRDIGAAHNLSDDSEIAALLLQVYKKGDGDDNSTASLCVRCHQPLPRYLCLLCCSDPTTTQNTPPQHCSRPSINPPLQDTKDGEVLGVKVEQEDSEGEPGSKKQRKNPPLAASSTAVDGGVDLVEVKVEVIAADDKDVKPVLSDDDDGSTLAVTFDEDKTDPTFVLPDDADLTEEASDPPPKPASKRKVGRKVKDKSSQKFECKHCSATFKQAYRLKRHSKIHAADYGKDRLYSCEQCRMTFRLKGSLDAHMRTHSGQQPYLCAICNLPFTRAKQTKQHVQSQHADSFNVVPCFKCATCQAEFVLYKKFTTHIWRHTLERRFQCEYCSMAFFEPSSLRVHQRVHTGDKPFTCSECGLSFHQLSNLNRHVLTHSGERPYRCTLCPATYPASQQLKRHLQGHRGEKPFLCQLCGASYTESKSLKFHIRSHTGEKPFKCDQCDKEFARPASLRVHKRTHSSVRPYICAICGASFADNSNLHRHHRLKHRGKPKKRYGGDSAVSGNNSEVSGSRVEQVSAQDSALSSSHHLSEGSDSSKTNSDEFHKACSVLGMGVGSMGTRRMTEGTSVGQGTPGSISGGGSMMVGGAGQDQMERLASQVPLLSASMMTYAHAVMPSVVPYRF